MSGRFITMETAGDAKILRFVVDVIQHEKGDEIVRDIRDGLYTLVENGHHKLLMNFDRLQAFPTLIVGPLLGLNMRLKKVDGQLKIVCAPDTFARECFDILNLGRVLSIYETEAQALAAS